MILFMNNLSVGFCLWTGQSFGKAADVKPIMDTKIGPTTNAWFIFRKEKGFFDWM